MRYVKYLIFIAVFIFSYGSKNDNLVGNQVPKYYTLELQGLNKRITNQACQFPKSDYIRQHTERFLDRWDLHGCSIAILYNDKLIFTGGYGQADNEGNRVTPGSLFRLASMSKLVTATGIMTLVDEGKLRLDAEVFGPKGILDDSVFYHVRDRRLYQITVRDLLVHAGGWTQRYGDPAFLPLKIATAVGDRPPATINSYYKFIARRRLSFAPGTQVAYSNMGYMFLGEVISKISGMPYEKYIRQKILLPHGIMDMHIGKSYARQKYTNEVNYYEQTGSCLIPDYCGNGQYVPKSNGGNCIQLLGAAGGWVASSVEMARFLTLIDGNPGVRDILSADAIREMANDDYAKGPLGWMVTYSNGNWCRTGSMAGTSVMLKRQANGYSWVFLINSSSWHGYHFTDEINRYMDRLMQKISDWPQKNLFHYYPIDSLKYAQK